VGPLYVFFRAVGDKVSPITPPLSDALLFFFFLRDLSFPLRAPPPPREACILFEVVFPHRRAFVRQLFVETFFVFGSAGSFFAKNFFPPPFSRHQNPFLELFWLPFSEKCSPPPYLSLLLGERVISFPRVHQECDFFISRSSVRFGFSFSQFLQTLSLNPPRFLFRYSSLSNAGGSSTSLKPLPFFFEIHRRYFFPLRPPFGLLPFFARWPVLNLFFSPGKEPTRSFPRLSFFCNSLLSFSFRRDAASSSPFSPCAIRFLSSLPTDLFSFPSCPASDPIFFFCQLADRTLYIHEVAIVSPSSFPFQSTSVTTGRLTIPSLPPLSNRIAHVALDVILFSQISAYAAPEILHSPPMLT